MTQTVLGYAWYVYPTQWFSDHLTALSVTRCSPSKHGEPGAVRFFCMVNPTDSGVRNYRTGPGYLVLTRTARAPELAEGWVAEPATIDEDDFWLQRGKVRLVRLLAARDTAWGRLWLCELAPGMPGPAAPLFAVDTEQTVVPQTEGPPWRPKAPAQSPMIPP